MLFSCSKPHPKIYSEEKPKLDIRKYLDGHIIAWGMLENYRGKVTSRFTVDMHASWEGDKGVLKEYFTFASGEKSERIWHIEFSDDNNFTATAADVIGTAKGEQYGNVMRMNYVLDLEVGDKNYHVKLDDWMYLIDDKILINKSKIKKFGVTVAKLTIFFQKVDE